MENTSERMVSLPKFDLSRSLGLLGDWEAMRLQLYKDDLILLSSSITITGVELSLYLSGGGIHLHLKPCDLTSEDATTEAHFKVDPQIGPESAGPIFGAMFNAIDQLQTLTDFEGSKIRDELSQAFEEWFNAQIPDVEE